MADPRNMTQSREAIAKSTDPVLSMDIASSYVRDWQSILSEGTFSQDQYPQDMNEIERNGEELRYLAIRQAARNLFEPLGLEGANKAWEAVKLGDPEGLDDEQTKAFKKLEAFGIENERGYGYQESFILSEKGLGRDEAREMGQIQMNQRSGRRTEFTISSSSRNIDQLDRTFTVDSDVDAKLSQLNEEIEAAKAELAKPNEPIPLMMGGGSVVLARATNESLQRKTIEKNTELIRRYGGAGGRRNYEVDQADEILADKYGDKFGNQGLAAQFGSIARGSERSGVNVAAAAAKAGAQLWMLPNRVVGGALDIAGFDQIASSFKEFRDEIFEDVDFGAKTAIEGTREHLKNNFIGIESTRFQGKFWGNVQSGILEELGPFFAQIAITGGSATAFRTAVAAGRGVAVKELVGTNAARWINNVAAPLVGSSVSGAREGITGWMDANETGQAMLEKAGFKSVEEAIEAGDTELGNKVQKIFNNSDKVFAATAISSTMIEMLAMRRYLGLGKRTLSGNSNKLLKEVLGDNAWTRLGSKIATANIEGSTEVAQNVMSRVWAKEWIDENRHLFPDSDEALQEYTIGFIMGFAADAVMSRRDPSQLQKEIIETEESKKQDRALINRHDARQKEITANDKAIKDFRQETGEPVPVALNNKSLDLQVTEQADKMIPVRDETPVELSAEEQQLAAIKDYLQNPDPSKIESREDVDIREKAAMSQSGQAAIDLYLESNNPTGDIDSQAQAILRHLTRTNAKVDAGRESGAREQDVQIDIARDDNGKNIAFDNEVEANDFRERQDRARFNKKKNTDKPLTRNEVNKILATVKKAKRTREEAAQKKVKKEMSPEKLREAKIKAKADKEASDNAAIQERADKKVRDRESGRGKANGANTRNDTVGFIQGAMRYLTNIDGESGTVLRNAFGEKYGPFVLIATEGGKNSIDSPEASAKIEKALSDLSNRGKLGKNSPFKGMEREIENMREMLESVYRNKSVKSRKSFSSQEAARMNTLFLGRSKRNNVSELKEGEAPSQTREHYVRPATVTGKVNKGFKKESWAIAAARRNPRARVEEGVNEDGNKRFFVISPIITPQVQANLSLTESISNMEPQGMEVGQVIEDMAPRQAVTDTADARRGFGLGGFGNSFLGKYLNDTNIFPTLMASDVINTAKSFLEDLYLARNQAFGETMRMRVPFIEENGIANSVEAKNGTDSTYAIDVAESIARGEDLYNMPDRSRAFFIRYRDGIKQLSDMAVKEGAKLKALGVDPMSINVDWDMVGIPGYIPHVLDYAATWRKAKGEGKTRDQFDAMIKDFGGIKTKITGTNKFEHRRRYKTVKEGVENGIVYKSLSGTFFDYNHGMRTKAAEARYKNDPRVREKGEDKEGEPIDIMDKNGLPVLTKEGKLAFDAVSNVSIKEWQKKLKAAATQVKIGLVGGDLGYLAIFGPSVAAASPTSFIKAVYQSVLALADPDAMETMIAKTDNQVEFNNMARFNVNIHYDPDFTAGTGEGSVANTFSNKLIKLSTLGAIPQADVFNKLGDAFRVFGTAASFYMWQGMTGNLTRNPDGTIADESAADAALIGDDINRISGRFDFKRHGLSDSVSTASTLLMFAPQMAAGFSTQFIKATQLQTKDGRKAARHLTYLFAGNAALFILGGLAMGLKKEELLERLNPLTAGNKWLSLPVRWANGTTDEISMAGFHLAVGKMIGSMSGSLLNNFDSLPESIKNDKGFWEAPTTFLLNRKNPLFTVADGMFRNRDFFNQPIPKRQAFIESLFPLPIQELTKRLANSFGAWVDPDRNGLYDNDAQMYIDPDVTWEQELGRVLVQVMGMSSYPTSVGREQSMARQRLSLETYGQEYDKLPVERRAVITDRVEAMPYFANKRTRLAVDGVQMHTRLRNFKDDTDKDEAAMRKQMDPENDRLMREMQIPMPDINYNVDIGGNRYQPLTKEERRNLRIATGRALDNTMTTLRRSNRWNGLSYEGQFEEAENAIRASANEVLKSFSWTTQTEPNIPLTADEATEKLNKLPQIPQATPVDPDKKLPDVNYGGEPELEILPVKPPEEGFEDDPQDQGTDFGADNPPLGQVNPSGSVSLDLEVGSPQSLDLDAEGVQPDVAQKPSGAVAPDLPDDLSKGITSPTKDNSNLEVGKLIGSGIKSDANIPSKLAQERDPDFDFAEALGVVDPDPTLPDKTQETADIVGKGADNFKPDKADLPSTNEMREPFNNPEQSKNLDDLAIDEIEQENFQRGRDRDQFRTKAKRLGDDAKSKWKALNTAKANNDNKSVSKAIFSILGKKPVLVDADDANKRRVNRENISYPMSTYAGHYTPAQFSNYDDDELKREIKKARTYANTHASNSTLIDIPRYSNLTKPVPVFMDDHNADQWIRNKEEGIDMIAIGRGFNASGIGRDDDELSSLQFESFKWNQYSRLEEDTTDNSLGHELTHAALADMGSKSGPYSPYNKRDSDGEKLKEFNEHGLRRSEQIGWMAGLQDELFGATGKRLETFGQAGKFLREAVDGTDADILKKTGIKNTEPLRGIRHLRLLKKRDESLYNEYIDWLSQNAPLLIAQSQGLEEPVEGLIVA